MKKEIEEVVTSTQVVVHDRYADLVPYMTNGASSLEHALDGEAKRVGKTFEEVYLEKSMELAEGKLKGHLGGLTNIFNKRVPDLKSVEHKVKGLTDEERNQAAKELSRSIIEE